MRSALRPPLGGSLKIVILFRCLGEDLQFLRERRREAGTLSLHPALEFHGFAQVESIEEWTAVQSDRLRVTSAGHSSLELNNI